MRPSCKCKFRHIDDTHTTHTLIQTFMQTSLLTHTYTFHPACELSQTNTRWLFCSWTGWPVSTAEGGHKGGGVREWEWKSACWRPPLGLPACALLLIPFQHIVSHFH